MNLLSAFHRLLLVILTMWPNKFTNTVNGDICILLVYRGTLMRDDKILHSRRKNNFSKFNIDF